ncbi:GntR family transcriptional regulator [Microbacterium marinilacus]|uniref:HTH gntR-type domain-containing protein n=1 Tax=Microbacterium marinilacus TaxID=415209 RepID=A0ABP7BXK0_9MICO|nr:GntR family transcriptional regulator [Microbacterium marinilacus]MBY0688183.1 GntR family transcriptional regulator [Microbacterium marinilacus]
MPPLSAPLTNRGPRLSDLAFDRLAEAIVDGTLPPGELLRDRVLATQLGVSRMPIREALQRLERCHLVETAASRFTRVTVFTPELVAAGIEYAGFLFASSMRMSVIRMTDEQHARAVTLLDELVAAETEHQYLSATGAVYRFAMATAGNEVLGRRSDVWYMFSCAARALPAGELVDRIGRDAGRLRDAVAARDADAAEAALRRMHGIV